ncbi:MAG: major capsid protein [Microviridae sp.]|nr:MAG: major capsid protein [Microviridae sp.]
MSALFQKIKVSKPKSNSFDLGHEKKLTMNAGDLVPILCQEVIPGDRFRVRSEMLMRLMPLASPAMHRVNVFTHFFFVPNRLVYSEWENFITGGEHGDAKPLFPQIQIHGGNKSGFKAGTLPDYMGVPEPDQDTIPGTLEISALPFRAYQLIYNEYFRDQNLTTKVPITKDSLVTTEESWELIAMRKRAWEKDYFTSALPWAQKGGEVELPTTIKYTDSANIFKQGEGQVPITTGGQVSTVAGNPGGLHDGDDALKIENIESLGTTINDLRKATRLQEWLEKNARGGSRYVESILNHFGIRSSDQRLQRPLFLGGGKSPITISEILSTVGTTEAPQGHMAGHGISVGSTHHFSHSFEEHGWIIGIMSILPRTGYQQGIERQFTKFDKFEYFWPSFANLGEQPIANKELFAKFDSGADDDQTFGYQSRYAEYKFKNSSVHGDFKNSLAYWHMNRIFSAAPALNDAFITADPTTRVFAVTDPVTHHYLVQMYNDIKAIRPMPYFGTPTL